MPKGITDESKWEKAKKAAEKQGRAKDYAYIMGIYKQMGGGFKKAEDRLNELLKAKFLEKKISGGKVQYIYDRPKDKRKIKKKSDPDKREVKDKSSILYLSRRIEASNESIKEKNIRDIAIVAKDRVEHLLKNKRAFFDGMGILRIHKQGQSKPIAAIAKANSFETLNDLLKATVKKYKRRWKGKDGKWNYEYETTKPKSKKHTKKEPEIKPKGESIALNYSMTDLNVFVKNRDKSVPEEFKAFVTPYTPKEYQSKQAKVYLSPDNQSGYAITKEGDMISVFSGQAGRLDSIMKTAIQNGAKTLDCIGFALKGKYEKYGFKVYESYAWDDKYAPNNWNYEKHDRPPVFMMKLEEEQTLQKGENMKNLNGRKTITEEEAQKIWDTMNPNQRKTHEDYANFMSSDKVEKATTKLSSLLKARSKKYYKRVPKPGGGYRYYYHKPEKSTKQKDEKNEWKGSAAAMLAEGIERQIERMDNPEVKKGLKKWLSDAKQAYEYDNMKLYKQIINNIRDKIKKGTGAGKLTIKMKQDVKDKGKSSAQEKYDQAKKAIDHARQIGKEYDTTIDDKGIIREGDDIVPLEQLYEWYGSDKEGNLEGYEYYEDIKAGVKAIKNLPKLREAAQKETGQMKLFTAQEKLFDLLKARTRKYIRRWKGKDGKWNYEYTKPGKPKPKVSQLEARPAILSKLQARKETTVGKGSADYYTAKDLEEKGLVTVEPSTAAGYFKVTLKEKPTEKKGHAEIEAEISEKLQTEMDIPENHADDMAEFIRDKDFDFDDISNIEDQGRYYELEVAGEDWIIAKSQEDAIELAKEDNRMLIDDMGVTAYNESFWKGHIDREKLIRELKMDSGMYRDDGYDDPENWIDEEPAGDDGDWTDEQREKAADAAEQEFIDRVEDDPEGYIADIYGEDSPEYGNFMMNYVDEEALIEDAVQIDGVAHFLAGYDHNEYEHGNLFFYRRN